MPDYVHPLIDNRALIVPLIDWWALTPAHLVVSLLAGYEIHLFTKYEVNPTTGLRGMLQNMQKTCILVTLTFVMTLTLNSRSQNIAYMLAGYEMHLSTKYEVHPTNYL